MKWFGPEAFSHACEEIPRAETPTGVCTWCEEGFAPEDCGYLIPLMGEVVTDLPYHLECHLRQIFGSVGHQAKACSCFGGTESDPMNMSKREGAKMAVDLFNLRGAAHAVRRNLDT